MAAVQRTPAPMDARTRRDFIESMEAELRRVQEHLDSRHWRHKRSESAVSHSVNVRPRQYYTLARSNPSSLRKSSTSLDAARKESLAERYAQDDLFCRASSAQDSGFGASTSGETESRSSNSSTTSTTSPVRPSPSPDHVRMKSPLFPTPTSPIKSPDIFSTPSRTNIIIPHSYKGPISPSFSSPTPPSPRSSLILSPKSPITDQSPSPTKEMSHKFPEQPKPKESKSLKYHDTEISKEVVMPSALDDLLTPLEESKERPESAYSNNEQESSDDALSETPREETTSPEDEDDQFRLFSKKELDGFRVKNFSDTKASEEATQEKTAHEEKAAPEEKAQTNHKLAQLVKQLNQQLEAKDSRIKKLQLHIQKEEAAKDSAIKKLTRENARLKKEKWDLLKKMREATERSVSLKAKLDYHNASLSSVELELDRANDELASVKAANNSLRLLVNELRAPKITNNVQVQVDTVIVPHSPLSTDIETQTDDLPGENDSGHASGLNVERISGDWSERLSIASSQYDPGRETPSTTPHLQRQGRERRSVKNLIKKFRRSASAGKRHSTSSLIPGNATSLDNLQVARSSMTSPIPVTRHVSPLENNEHRFSTVSLNEPLDANSVLESFRNVPFSQWNTKAIVAWMEVIAGMPQYTATVRQHVTSGHALLALSNSDIEKRLGIAHPLHRRRLRLSIEEARNILKGNSYPEARNIDHNWVAYTWAIDCGLPHLSGSLYNGMVDGRVLNSLTKDDIKKYLKITKKVEQMSFMAGVELLRMHDFRREVIQSHQQTTNNPLYWSNRDVCDWLSRTELESYSEKVIGTGVHGALLFLERGNFGSEQLAAILHLPGAKSPLRKQLSVQLAKLFSNEDITSLSPDNDGQPLEEAPPSGLVRAVSPSTSESSPHPARRNSLRQIYTSNPDLTEERSGSTFNRFHQNRASLRESVLISVNIPDTGVPSPRRTYSASVVQRPHSQVVTSTAV